jgi:hypothetical protein
MKNPSDPLLPLLAAAARAPDRPLTGPSRATETRTLHAWRSARAGREQGLLLELWRTGLATAFGVAAIAVSISYFAAPPADADSTDFYSATTQELTVAINTTWQP